jgi:hypothetical protein
MTNNEVYLDPRRVNQSQQPQEEPRLTAEQQEIESNVEMGKAVAIALTSLVVTPFVLMIVWNAIVPGLFALSGLNYLQSMGIIVISKLIRGK